MTDAQHLENWFCHKGKPMFWPFILNQTMNTDFLIQLWRFTLPTDSTWTPFHHQSWATKKQKTPQYLKNRFCHQGESVFWPFLLNQTSPDWLHGWTGILVEPVKTVYHCSRLRKCVFMVWFSNMARKLNCLKPYLQVLRTLLVLGRASSTGGKVFKYSQSVLCTTVVGSENLYSWFDSV